MPLWLKYHVCDRWCTVTGVSLTEAFRKKLSTAGFDIDAELGHGAFGSVYRATQRTLQRQVAVKVISPGAARNPSDEQRFKREALLLAKVSHPGVPYVLTKGSIEGTHFFVMQYVEGEPLDHTIQRVGRLDAVQAVSICTDILLALAAAHDAKVIHRDIKPNNVMLGDCRAYLIDFSLGFCQEPGPGLTRTTVDRGALGVFEYASPEQKRNPKDVDCRTDIYSVGVVLFEMLSGHAKIPTGDFGVQLSHCSSGLIAVVAKACELTREGRYQTTTEFLSALDSATTSTTLKFDRRVGLILMEAISQQTDQNSTLVGQVSDGLREQLTKFEISMGIGNLHAAGLIDVRDEEDWNGNALKTIFVNKRGFVQAQKWDAELSALAVESASAHASRSYPPAGDGYGGYGGYSGDDDIPF